MKSMALVGLAFVLMILMVDLLDVYAREFEHGITDSKLKSWGVKRSQRRSTA